MKKINDDIQNFLDLDHKEVFFNERDFQVQLATYLRETHHYDDVELEYFIPYNELENYIWKSELRLDIVLKKNGRWIPVELKYKTKALKKTLSRFDEKLDNIVVLKNQGAQDLGLYDFWKDVRRVELVRKRFEKVSSGFCVFVTNDPSYLKTGVNPDVSCHEFSMSEGKHSRSRHWQGQPLIQSKHPDFELDKEYEIHWKSVSLGQETFLACILEV